MDKANIFCIKTFILQSNNSENKNNLTAWLKKSFFQQHNWIFTICWIEITVFWLVVDTTCDLTEPSHDPDPIGDGYGGQCP